MSSFVTSSACRGQRPNGLVMRHQYERPHLIARLLKDRRVARFVVAPAGFGKTSLVFEYADVVFSFKRVFWIKCDSPCFLRDLDHGSLAADILRADRSVSLVVLEDVPALDHDRSRAFAAFVDAMLEAESEVLVTCTPACDVYSVLQRDRLLITGFDLLLQDAELRTRVSGRGLHEEDHRMIPRSERVACLRWKEGGEKEFAASIGAEELPGDVSMALLAMLVLGHGDLASLSAFVPEKRLGEVLALLAAGYPYLGVDLAHGIFESAHMSIDALAQGCLPLFERSASASRYESRSALACRFADALVARGSYDRAVALVATVSSRADAGDWLLARGWQLVFGRAAGQTYWLYSRIARDPAHESPKLCALAAWAALVLDDPANAQGLAKRVLLSRTAAEQESLASCLVAVQLDSPDLAERALDGMAALLAAHPRQPSSRAASSRRKAGASDLGAWAHFARVFLACRKGPYQGLAEWIDVREAFGGCSATRQGAGAAQMVPADVMLGLAAVHLLDSWLAAEANAGGEGEGEPMVCVLDYLDSRLADAVSHRQRIGWLELEMARALHDAHLTCPGLFALAPAYLELQRFRNAQAELYSQRAAYARLRAEEERRMKDYCETHPDPFRKDIRILRSEGSSLRSAAPMLHVKLFGNFEVRIGNEDVGERLAKQRKAKVLLAILVISRGRELSKDYLASLIWPESSAKAARKNFYPVWLQLSRALEVEGSCPYLIRDKEGCRIDSRLLTSDVEEYEALCRYLLAGKVHDWEWHSLFLRISEVCSHELMPGMEDNDYLRRQRLRYRLSLTDSLVFASGRLLQAGELQGSVWFAREAWHQDHMREDACMALMRAQAASGQRGSAIESFFMLKQSLAAELGIDPSQAVVDLYGSILEPQAIPA